MSPLCTLTVTLHEGGFTFNYVAADGATVTLGQWPLILTKLAVAALENGATPIPDSTRIEALRLEAEAARALPEGWTPTLDGVGVTLEMGRGVRHTRTYLDTASGRIVEAPCDAKGDSLPETRIALLDATKIALAAADAGD